MNILNAIGNTFEYVSNMIRWEDFRKEELGRIFSPEQHYNSAQVIAFINYLGMTEQLDSVEDFHLFANINTLEEAVEMWEEYKGNVSTSTSTLTAWFILYDDWMV